jgi:hypothetical protein
MVPPKTPPRSGSGALFQRRAHSPNVEAQVLRDSFIRETHVVSQKGNGGYIPVSIPNLMAADGKSRWILFSSMKKERIHRLPGRNIRGRFEMSIKPASIPLKRLIII